MKATVLPNFLRPFFWDVTPATLDVREYWFFVLERLLELGDDQAIRWVLTNFTDDEIIAVLRQSARISPRTANWWALKYGLKRGEMRCFSRYSQETRELFWRS